MIIIVKSSQGELNVYKKYWRIILYAVKTKISFDFVYIFTPPRSRGGVIFSLQFVCVCVCLSVCVSNFSCEQNSSRTDAQIWTRYSLNGCLLHWLRPYWIWWPCVKGQGHSDVIPIFFLLYILSWYKYLLLCLLV